MSSKKTSSFSVGPTEALHIIISVVTISLAFTLFPVGSFDFEKFTVVAVTVGAGFVLHELAHKYFAIKYGAKAEFRAWTWGLFLALAMAFLTNGSFIFAAPGAVYIFGKIVSKEENGRIALAGPLVNLLLATVFIVIGMLAPRLSMLAGTGVYVNAFLGAFNLIPITPLDGSKVFAWNKLAWATVLLSNLAILFLLF